jgi:hypothetical protein
MPLLNLPSLHIDDAAAATLPAVVIAQLAGEENADNLSAEAARWLVMRDFLYTLSVMCAPNDDGENVENDGLVEQLHHALNADEMYHAVDLLNQVEGLREGISISAEVALSFVDRDDPKDIIDALLANDWLAHIAAGYILRWIVSRWRDPVAKSEASLTQAVGAIEQWCKNYGIKGGGEQNITRNMWPKYKSVSHLWAAFYVMKDADIDVATEEGFVSFCSTAQWLLEEGTKIVPKGRRAGETILTLDEAWTVPSSHVRRAIYRDTGADAGIVAVWKNELGAHDIREIGRPPSMDKQV